MTINMATTQMSATYAMDLSKLKISGASADTQNESGSTASAKTQGSSDSADAQKMSGSASTQAGTSEASELTDEEKKYDADGDGTLSITEEAAYLEAKLREKSLEALKKSTSSDNAATVSISTEALKLQKQGMPQGSPPNVNEMSDDDIKNMLNGMKEKNGQLPKELSDYNDAYIDNLSDEDLKKIRETMVQMQEKMAEKMNGQTENEQQRLVNQAITEYSKFK